MGLVEFAALVFLVLTARWWLPIVIMLALMAIPIAFIGFLIIGLIMVIYG